RRLVPDAGVVARARGRRDRGHSVGALARGPPPPRRAACAGPRRAGGHPGARGAALRVDSSAGGTPPQPRHFLPILMSAPDRVHDNRLLVALFVTAISLPLAANLAGRDGADPAAENREMATFPRVGFGASDIAAFGPGLSAWFEDHFGFRAALVRW